MPPILFPKMLYREDGQTRVVATQAAQDALGSTWSEVSTVIKRGFFRVPCKAGEYVVLAENLKRKSVKIVNDSTSVTRILYADSFPAGISATLSTWDLDPGERWEMPLVIRDGRSQPDHLGLITAITELETGGLKITETVFD